VRTIEEYNQLWKRYLCELAGVSIRVLKTGFVKNEKGYSYLVHPGNYGEFRQMNHKETTKGLASE
jgi:hypothetical protein